MSRKVVAIISLLAGIACVWTACKDDVATTGQSVLEAEDRIIVLSDTFPIRSAVDSCDAIISQADSFLLGEIETDYGLLHASVLTQLACPEGYSYPAESTIDSVCLFMYYSSWVGDANSPIALNAYLMDRKTFTYSGTYPTDLKIEDYCTRDKSILTNHRIVAASEKLDSILNTNGKYIPMVRMRLNDDFTAYFSAIRTFESQDKYNEQFKGLLIETAFGSSTMLNVTDIALGVYYHFSYNKAGRDTTVNDMKAFYANSEVRTVNHLQYHNKQAWVEKLQQDSDTYNYIIAPAGVYTRMRLPMRRIADSINAQMQQVHNGDTIEKRPYVNKAEVRVHIENVYSGTESGKKRNDWLQPATHMLLVKEQSMNRFFRNRELPSDTCALLATMTQSVDSLGEAVYYYSYDLSDLLTNQLRKESKDSVLNMVLVPVTIGTTTTLNSSTVVSSVRQQQTVSATKIRSAKNGLNFEIVYSGF